MGHEAAGGPSTAGHRGCLASSPSGRQAVLDGEGRADGKDPEDSDSDAGGGADSEMPAPVTHLRTHEEADGEEPG